MQCEVVSGKRSSVFFLMMALLNKPSTSPLQEFNAWRVKVYDEGMDLTITSGPLFMRIQYTMCRDLLQAN